MKQNVVDWIGRLKGPHRRAVRAALRVAREQGANLYLVGGTVRDMLLGRRPQDLDLMIEGDARRFARAMAALLKAQWRYEPRFLTASVILAEGVVDIARARRETYARPGALPQVSPAHSDDDLIRRDFSINAMAVGLAGLDRGRLFGPYSVRGDVQARILRVLHERSFTDDPTRILRGIRLAARLGFSFDAATRRLAVAAVCSGMVGRVSADRIRQEIYLLLGEPDPAAALSLAKRIGLTHAILPGLSSGGRLSDALARARECAHLVPERDRREVLLLCVLAFSAQPVEAARCLGLSGSALNAVRVMSKARRSLARRLTRARPSAVVRVLDALPLQVVIALASAARSQRTREQMVQYLKRWRLVKPKITGNDLLRLGFAEGAALGAALRAARDAQLDGKATTRKQQMLVALARLRGKMTGRVRSAPATGAVAINRLNG